MPCRVHLAQSVFHLKAGTAHWDLVKHTYNLSAEEMKVGGWWVQGQSGLQSDLGS